MPTILIIAAIAGALLLFSKTSEGKQLLNSVSPVTWYVPTDSDLNTIQNNYPEHGKYRTYALHSLAALQITTDLFDPNSKFCQAAGVAEVAPVVGQKIGEGLQAASIAASIGSKFATIGSEALQLSTKALSAIPIIGSVVSGFTMAFGFIQAKHAAAVKKENMVACPIVPAINAQFIQINSDLRSRKITGAQAMGMLQQMQVNANQVFSQDPHAGIVEQLTHITDGIIKVFALIIQKTGV